VTEPLTAAQIAAVLLIINGGPPWQEVCITGSQGESCAEYQAYDDPVWSNPSPNVYYLSTPEQEWAVECGDDIIKYGDGKVCVIGGYSIGVAFEGYGISIIGGSEQ